MKFRSFVATSIYMYVLIFTDMLEWESMTGSQSDLGSFLLNQKKVGVPGLHLARHSSLSSSPSNTL